MRENIHLRNEGHHAGRADPADAGTTERLSAEGWVARADPADAGTTPTKGRFFQHTFKLPENNRRHRAKTRKPPTRKPARKPTARKPQKEAAPKARQPKRRPEPTPAEVEAKRQKLLNYYRLKNQTPEYKEHARLFAQEKRRKAKELGLCRDCPNPAIPDRTKCETCAAKHKEYRRRTEEQAAQQRHQASGQAKFF